MYKILLLGESGVGKSCIILQYTENNFSNNLMNSIGVDFKLKSIEIDGKIIKLQIVRENYILIKKYSGIQRVKKDLEQSQPHIIKEHKE